MRASMRPPLFSGGNRPHDNSLRVLQLHGRLRATGATLLREHGFSRDVVELLLAHKERNPTTAAYHHHELADERRRALQYLADQIHHLAEVNGQQLPSSEISVTSTQREPANC